MADMSIALGARPVQITGPMDNMLMAMKLKEAHNQNALHELGLQEAQNTATERNALRRLNPADTDYQDQLMRVSPTQGLAYMKEKHLATTAAGIAAKSRVDMLTARQGLEAQAKRDLNLDPSDDNLDRMFGRMALSGAYSPAELEENAQELAQFKQIAPEVRKQMFAGVGASAKDLQPTFKDFSIPGVGVQTGTVRQGAFAPDKLYVSSDVISPEAELQKARIAAGRAPAQPRPEQPPVAVVDPVSGKQVLVSREEAITKRMSPAAAMESLAPKEIQRREATYPQATVSMQGLENKSEKFIKDLELLRNHKGLNSITGIAAGRLPGITTAGRAAQALYDKVVAKGGFQALQDMREASKTGGALGNVSNQEGKQLVSSFSAIDRKQEAKDVRAAIDQAIEDIRGAKSRIREAYDSTYQYKRAKPEAAPPPSGLTPAEQAELAALKVRFNK